MAEGSYWSNEFSCPTIAAFLHESVCANTEDVAGAGELVTDTGTRTRRSHTMDNKQQGDAHCSAYEQCLLGPSSAQELPRGLLKDTDRSTNNWTRTAAWDGGKTAWHHSSYHCLRLVLVTINSSMQYATTQRQGPPTYIIGTDSCIRVVAYTFCVPYCCIKDSLLCNWLITQFLYVIAWFAVQFWELIALVRSVISLSFASWNYKPYSCN